MSYILNILKKKSVKNGMWLYLLQIFNTVVPFLTLPYITRVLGSSSYGIFVIALNIVSYFQVAIEYGFGMSATRKVALMEDDSSLSRLHTRVLLARMAILTLCIAVAACYVVLANADRTLIYCIFTLFISLLGYCIQQNWLFQGKQEMKFISIVNIIGRVVSVILIFLFVKEEKDLVLYCLLYSVSPFLSSVIGFVVARKRYGLHIVAIKAKEIGEELKDGFYVFTTQLSSKVFGAIGITFLGFFAANNIVGVFGAIQKIPNIIIYAWAPISQVLYPISSIKMTESFNKGIDFINKIRRKVLPPFLLLAILLSLFSKQVVRIAFGNEYAAFHYWIIPLLGWMLIAINNNFIGIQILLGSGHDKEYGKAFQFGVVCTVFINLGLTFFLQGNGAAIAPFFSEMILYLALRQQLKKVKKGAHI